MIPIPNAESPILFADRVDAGQQLAQAVIQTVITLPIPIALVPGAFIVYALPRGGLPIGAAIASVLRCPLDIVVAKKVVRPDDPELAIGAVTAEGQVMKAQHYRSMLPPEDWQAAVELAQEKAKSQLARFAKHRSHADPRGRIALLVDDGVATGMTMAIAARALRERQLREIWICTPVAPKELARTMQEWCDRLIVLSTPERFFSVSRFYRSFPQLSTTEALAYLENSSQD